jgi:hypothetical protein
MNRWRRSANRCGFCPPFIRMSDRVVKYRRGDVERWLNSRRVDPEVA